MIKLTKEQAEKANKAWLSEYGSPAAEWSAVANALVQMGVLVEPTPPAPGPTIEQRVAAYERRISYLESKSVADESKHLATIRDFGLHNQRLAALEAKANRPASEPFVPTDPDYPADVLKAYPKAREHGVVLWGPSESGKYEWRTADDAHCWTRPKSLWETNAWPKEGYYTARDWALKNAPTSPPPGYVEPKPDPKPTPSLIEACAEAAYEADRIEGSGPWTSLSDRGRESWRKKATAAITRFLEEPPSHEEADRACDAYLLVNGQQSGVRVNLGRMDAALEASRRVLLERVKGGV